uniref:C2H2-type domain-containing protein n=1 Tax=Caenorhabditis tropicalis TaxID=1561998 RepID=A0A1I7UJ10_9PELO
MADSELKANMMRVREELRDEKNYQATKTYFSCSFPISETDDCERVGTYSEIHSHMAWHVGCPMYVCRNCLRNLYDHTERYSHKHLTGTTTCLKQKMNIPLPDTNSASDLWRARNCYIQQITEREYNARQVNNNSSGVRRTPGYGTDDDDDPPPRGRSPGTRHQSRGRSPGTRHQSRGRSPGTRHQSRGRSPGTRHQSRGRSRDSTADSRSRLFANDNTTENTPERDAPPQHHVPPPNSQNPSHNQGGRKTPQPQHNQQANGAAFQHRRHSEDTSHRAPFPQQQQNGRSHNLNGNQYTPSAQQYNTPSPAPHGRPQMAPSPGAQQYSVPPSSQHGHPHMAPGPGAQKFKMSSPAPHSHHGQPQMAPSPGAQKFNMPSPAHSQHGHPQMAPSPGAQKFNVPPPAQHGHPMGPPPGFQHFNVAAGQYFQPGPTPMDNAPRAQHFHRAPPVHHGQPPMDPRIYHQQNQPSARPAPPPRDPHFQNMFNPSHPPPPQVPNNYQRNQSNGIPWNGPVIGFGQTNASHGRHTPGADRGQGASSSEHHFENQQHQPCTPPPPNVFESAPPPRPMSIEPDAYVPEPAVDPVQQNQFANSAPPETSSRQSRSVHTKVTSSSRGSQPRNPNGEENKHSESKPPQSARATCTPLKETPKQTVEQIAEESGLKRTPGYVSRGTTPDRSVRRTPDPMQTGTTDMAITDPRDVQRRSTSHIRYHTRSRSREAANQELRKMPIPPVDAETLERRRQIAEAARLYDEKQKEQKRREAAEAEPQRGTAKKPPTMNRMAGLMSNPFPQQEPNTRKSKGENAFSKLRQRYGKTGEAQNEGTSDSNQPSTSTAHQRQTSRSRSLSPSRSSPQRSDNYPRNRGRRDNNSRNNNNNHPQRRRN